MNEHNEHHLLVLVGIGLLGFLMGMFGTSFVSRYIESSNKMGYHPQEIVIEEPEFMSMSPEEGLWDAMDYYGIIFPDIVYSQAVLETGWFKSEGCTKYNNLFGLYDSVNKDYYKFNHWSESVQMYKLWIQDKYSPEEGYYQFLEELGYAEDPDYINKVKNIAKQLGI